MKNSKNPKLVVIKWLNGTSRLANFSFLQQANVLLAALGHHIQWLMLSRKCMLSLLFKDIVEKMQSLVLYLVRGTKVVLDCRTATIQQRDVLSGRNPH